MMTSRLLARWPVVLCLVLAPWAFSGAEAIATDETAATSPCDDGNPCTVDAAIPIAGCVHGWVIAGTACDDGNSCTQGDACDGAGTCIGQNAPAGAVCDDHNDCTVGESCDASGRCIGGAQLPASTCDDGNACTVDACDLIVGHCVHPPAATGTACDDRNGCTRGDACDGAGVCRGTAEAAGTVCDDGNSCTVGETCDGAGRCANGLSLPLGTACDDGDVCTEGETCMLAAGGGSIACQGAARDCDDGDLCTTDTCDRRTGECAHSGCDDGNACTADRCDPASGCVHDSLENQPCDDLDVCTTGERTICVNGAIVCGGGSPSSTAQFCAFSASIPDVQRSCQTVYCDRTRGCVTVVTCHPDSNQCTSDYCQFYQCHHDPLPAGASCDDGRLCTVSDICLDSPRGFCFGRPACDDDDPCTDDLCDPATGGCTHSSRLGQTCYWGFTKCSAGGVCVQQPGGVVCQGATPYCDDHNACTEDHCVISWYFIDPRSCSYTLTSACNDQNPCTKDTCDPATGACQHEPNPGAACNDGNVCTQNDRCVQDPAGGIACQGDPVGCDDQNACTTDRCDPATGQCGHVDVSCDDQSACTVDSCDPVLGCQHVPDPSNCVEQVVDIKMDFEEKGSAVVMWLTTAEFDVRGFNVVSVDNKGNRVQLNPVLIPCEECVTGLGSQYRSLAPKHKSSKSIFVEMVLSNGTVLTFGPARPS